MARSSEETVLKTTSANIVFSVCHLFKEQIYKLKGRELHVHNTAKLNGVVMILNSSSEGSNLVANADK